MNDKDFPTTDEVRDIWIDHMSLMPDDVPAMREVFDSWLGRTLKEAGRSNSADTVKAIPDAMSNRKLIEEAAKAIYNDDPAWGYIYEDDHGEHAADWDYLGGELHEKFLSLAEGVLAVFEKANTPTNDEVQRLAQEWAEKEFPESILAPENEKLADAAYEGFIAGFRRSEEPVGVAVPPKVTGSSPKAENFIPRGPYAAWLPRRNR